MKRIVVDKENRVCGAFSEDFKLIKDEETIRFIDEYVSVTFLYPASFRVIELSDCPDNLGTYEYTYTEEKGFQKIIEPEPELELTEQEKIEQAYRDRLAKEVSENGYNA